MGLFHTRWFTSNTYTSSSENSTTGFSTHTRKNGFITHTWTTKLYNLGNHLTKCASQFSVCLCLTPPPTPFFLLPHLFPGTLYLSLCLCVCMFNLRIIFICVMFSCVLRNSLFYTSLVMHICTYWHTVQHKIKERKHTYTHTKYKTETKKQRKKNKVYKNFF